MAHRIAFMHASMFSPSLSTWCKAIDSGRMTTWPDLTSAQVRRHPPHPAAMIQGHLDQQRANLRSTQPLDTAQVIPEDDPIISTDMNPQPTEPQALKSHHLFATCEKATGQIYTDPTGRFITPSSSGNTDMLILYDYDNN